MKPADLRRADRLFVAAGLRRLNTPGHAGHRFYVIANDGRWHKLDVKTARLRRTGQAEGGARRWIRAAARRRPASLRRLGPVVAILGPDGAGKGTVIAELQSRIPIGLTAMYLGAPRRRRPELEAGTNQASDTAGRRVREARSHGSIVESALVLRKILRVWRPLLRAYAAAWCGHVVLCDRHPIETLAIRPDRTRAAAAVERALVRHFIPHPDAIVILDAPADVLLSRKQEHPAETLERWRRSYTEVFGSSGALVVSTSRPLEDTVAQVSDFVWQALGLRRGW
jgi:thymidylate kinase